MLSEIVMKQFLRKSRDLKLKSENDFIQSPSARITYRSRGKVVFVLNLATHCGSVWGSGVSPHILNLWPR